MPKSMEMNLEVNSTIDLRHCCQTELLASMPSKSVDLVLTDCPFGMEFQSGKRKEKWDKIANDDNLDWLPAWASQIRRVVKDDSHIYIFCSWHKIEVFKSELQKYFDIKNVLVWYKKGGGMGDLKGGYGGCYELIIYINCGKDLNGKRDSDVINGAYRTGNEHHPTEKPTNLMLYLINKSSQEGDLVLDCFAGGGSTAIACHEGKRRFIGCEIDATYYATACRRIKEAQMQTSLF